MKPRTLLLVLAASLLTVAVLAAEMPYAGQQARTIKALSDDDIAALRKGEGMGMAKAAELNGYPGPVHVLTLATQLGLTESQQRDVTAIFARMSAAALGSPHRRAQADIGLGEHVVKLERLGEVGVEHHGAVGDRQIIPHHRHDIAELARALVQ